MLEPVIQSLSVTSGAIQKSLLSFKHKPGLIFRVKITNASVISFMNVLLVAPPNVATAQHHTTSKIKISAKNLLKSCNFP